MIQDSINNIEKLFASDIKTYQIHKDTNLSTQFIDGYRKDGRDIEKMTLVKAKILEDYYRKIKK